MTSQNKKEHEREIVDLVYGFRRPFQIDDSEQPDFLAKLTPLDEPFGIEATEFFQSESSARLKRIPDYVGKLLDGGAFRHRVDQRELRVGKGQILSAGKEVVAGDVPMIVQEVPPLRECAARVAGVIRAKDEKLAPAFQRLRHVNLIICDRTDLLGHHKPGDFYSLYCTEALRDSLFGSRFREVYFVTRLSVGEVFIPLKMVLTIAQLYFFNAVAQSGGLASMRTDPSIEFMQCFASYLCTIVVDEVRIRGNGLETEVLYGDTGFLLDAELRPQLRIYSDTPVAAGEAATVSLSALPDPTIADRMRSFQLENTFETGVAFKVRSGDYAEG
jgi:hypothetical protein